MAQINNKKGKNRMHKDVLWLHRISRTLLAAVALVTVNSAIAGPLLYDVRYNPLLKGETELQLVFDEELTFEPKVQVFNSPARIEMFFDSAELEVGLNDVEVNQAGISSVTNVLTNSGLKVTVNLDRLKIYETEVHNNLVSIRVSDNPLTEPENEDVVMDSGDESGNYINRIQSIDFRRGEKGEAKVLVFLQDTQAAIEVHESGGKIYADFHHTDILDDLLYELDVLDFGTVVSNIETFKEDGLSRVVIEPNAQFTFTYQQIDNILTLTVEKDETQNAYLDGGVEYQGRPMTLNFQDISVRAALQIIAGYNDFNLVTSDSVTGNITLRLDGVPWDQALDVVLRIKGLDKRMDGSILMVAPAEELAAREAKDLKAKQQVEDLEPLYSEYIRLNYAKAENFADLLKTDTNSIITARGSVSVDQRTNTLLVKDTVKSIENIRRMIETLDIPVQQVVIESRMVTVRDNVTEDLGVRWGFSDQGSSVGISGSLEGAEGIYNATSTSDAPSISDRLNVNLPITNPAASIGLHIAKLANGTLIDLELSALEEENKGEIIASPRIIAANQQKARIEQGTEIPYTESASSGATTVSFKKAVLSLEVTPHITPDNKVILDLIITQDTRGDTVQTGTGEAVSIDTQEIQTQVLVENGQTVVLGGIFQQQIINTTSKVPILGDIPYVGRLFKTTSEFNEKRELLIFVTPKIQID
ncbi:MULTISPECIES: type IV pilus secretin PilQ family protein [Pseudoalteromonas]|jgi:type IV pilus assembly protein PilQ|uniref:type IV pilus secretin PilQ n=1 Tax=Pseudoalteromonas TaxID=53246 RepID=UPI00040A55F9|nr:MULTISPECIES: type IV pilus secretin PilQ family protein [Pseudoalteromonas]MBB1325870.1 type IV pilus secretin PilQ family protein [Pseudoalteromonas sp. SR45-1]MBB1350380.1 type IV pilus secretin PilQ family protein [Pseudoalteromonas sp. SG45-3]MBB1355138.1 type IV pilus secretin PilQ family protein [Pseudoalteromonas sp. SR45-5]MBB1357487.1 type IV pilus secretin PilQ family protein [Pseudoalteromonas sp. SG45-6]MBB1429268.1 type IV pilus secretin PilQ family protein [Pseudoalteromonas |tara:strand:- start:946 stop:3051 length:2106 start_codon:yes stop_codon:yes gene_type:complete